ncbi:MAG: APC family permease [Gemmatimonadaceae bacterium]
MRHQLIQSGARTSVAEASVTETGLVRVIGVRGLAANTLNNMVGSGIFVLPAVIAATLGAAAIIAYVICAIAAGLIALVFAEAGSRVSAPGGTYAYIETAFGPFPGFLAGVLFWFGSQMISSAAIATVFVGSLAALMPALGAPVLRALVLILLYVVLAALNIRGVRTGINIVETFTAAKLLPLVLLVVAGAFFVRPAHLAWTFTPTFSQIGTASLLLVFAFMGTEGALTSSGEVRDPARTVPRAVLLALIMVSVLYIALQLVAQGVLGPDLARDQTAPLVAVAQRAFGSYGGALLVVAAAVSAFGFISGDMLATPRVLFAFGRDGFLPRKFGTVNARHHSPAIAIVAHATACCAFAITGTFRSLVILSTVATLLIYLACCFSSIELRRRNIHADGPPFRLRGGPTIPLLAAGVVIWMLTSASRVEYTSVAMVLVVATVLYFIRPRRSIPLTGMAAQE